nr:zinc ribbon domain-containing protein [uncultured Albidiferax sp.]
MPQGSHNGGLNCPSCRTLNTANARFCQQCGTSMVPARCAHCGTTMQAGAKFCGQCGKAPA